MNDQSKYGPPVRCIREQAGFTVGRVYPTLRIEPVVKLMLGAVHVPNNLGAPCVMHSADFAPLSGPASIIWSVAMLAQEIRFKAAAHFAAKEPDDEHAAMLAALEELEECIRLLDTEARNNGGRR